MIEPVVRRVEPGDLEACVEVERKSFPPAEAASKTNISLRIDRFPQGFYVALWKSEIVGLVNSGATDKEDISDEKFKALEGHDSQGRNIVIFSLAVQPEFRKMGFAGSLMRRFIDESMAMGKEKIMLICKTPLIGYYQRLGFTYAGKSASSHGGAEWHEMILPLQPI